MLAFLAPLTLALPGNAQALAADADRAAVLVTAQAAGATSREAAIAIHISGFGLEALDRDALGLGPLNSDDALALASADEAPAARSVAPAFAALPMSSEPTASVVAAPVEASVVPAIAAAEVPGPDAAAASPEAASAAASMGIAISIAVAPVAVSNDAAAEAGGPVHDADALFSSGAVSESVLADTSGRENLNNFFDANVRNSAVVGNNRVGDNSTTGQVTISDSAFQNLSGISIMNFNTGNNSSINTGMSVNLQINYAQMGQ